MLSKNGVIQAYTMQTLVSTSTSLTCLYRVKPKFFVSGSEDCTLKIWTMPDDLDLSVPKEIHAAVTEKAHDKTISSVAVAPNDKFIASGSMDKTAKVEHTNIDLVL